MIEIDLLHAFVSVVDVGGFTQAGARVHRTQSTVSQKIRRLEAALGRPVFLREGRSVRLTEEGERLLGYARRILALSVEAQAAAQAASVQVVRLGVPEDFALVDLTRVVAAFAQAHPQVRLSVRCDLSVALAAGIGRGDYDVVLFKREPGAGPARAAWPERPVWIASAQVPVPDQDPVPLIAFSHGCLYRRRAIAALEASGRKWRIAYESPNLLGLQAALAGGLGVALLEQRSVTAEHRILDGMFPQVAPTELALSLAPEAGPAAAALADVLERFCGAAVARFGIAA